MFPPLAVLHQDAFRVVDGQLHHTFLSVTSASEVTDTTDPELIRTLNAVWSYEPVSPTAPIFDDPDLDAIVRQYASRHQVMHLSMQRLLACRGDWGGKHCLVGHCVAVSV